MSKNLVFGLPSKGSPVVQSVSNEPKIHLKDDSMFLNAAAMKSLKIDFVTGRQSKVAILSFSSSKRIALVNGLTTDIPNMIKSSIYRSGKISHSKFQIALSGVLDVDETKENKNEVLLEVHKDFPQILMLDI